MRRLKTKPMSHLAKQSVAATGVHLRGTCLTMINQIETQCRRRGLRLTGQRRLITQILTEGEDHPDVAELHRRAVERDPHVSLATVYRTVKRLEGEGILERHAFRGSRSRYEVVTKTSHDYLIDIETGRVVEFRNAEIERLQNAIAHELGYKLINHRLELYAAPLKSSRRVTD